MRCGQLSCSRRRPEFLMSSFSKNSLEKLSSDSFSASFSIWKELTMERISVDLPIPLGPKSNTMDGSGRAVKSMSLKKKIVSAGELLMTWIFCIMALTPLLFYRSYYNPYIRCMEYIFCIFRVKVLINEVFGSIILL